MLNKLHQGGDSIYCFGLKNNCLCLKMSVACHRCSPESLSAHCLHRAYYPIVCQGVHSAGTGLRSAGVTLVKGLPLNCHPAPAVSTLHFFQPISE